jgi:hypothetical protein
MSTITLNAQLFTTGLGDVGFRFMDATGAFSGARVTAGVFEYANNKGVYGVSNPTIPTDAVAVYWDSTGTPSANATEIFDAAFGNVEVQGTWIHNEDFTYVGALNHGGVVNFNTNVNYVGPVTFDGAILYNSTVVYTGDVTYGDNFIVTSSFQVGTDFNITGSLNMGANFNVIGDFNAGGVTQTGAWGGGGGGTGGAFAITIHADDGTNDIQNAIVSVRNGAVLIGTDTTDVNGDTSGLSDDNGTYDVTATANGYQNYSGTITVSGIGTHNIVMVANATPAPPADPLLQTVYGTLWAINEPAVNAEVKFTLVPSRQGRPLTINGNVITFPVKTVLTDSNGFFTIDLLRTDILDADTPATYTIQCSEADMERTDVSLGAAPLDISTL